ncbi:MAG: hypothetical protein AB1442_17390 [Nitrospirota bacterium]
MFIDELTVALTLRQLATELKVDYGGGSITLNRHERAYELNLYPPAFVCGSKPMVQIPARFELKTDVSSFPAFSVRKNDVIDWISEHIFFQHDFQVQDEFFDGKYFIDVQDTAWAQKYFVRAKITTCISHILGAGFDRVFSIEKELKAAKLIKSTDDCLSSDALERAMEEMSLLITKTFDGTSRSD